MKFRNKRSLRGENYCDICWKTTRTSGLRKFKGKYYCNSCYMKLSSVRDMQSISDMIHKKNKKTLKEALSKVYRVRTYSKNKGQGFYCQLSLPSVMKDKKVRFVLVK